MNDAPRPNPSRGLTRNQKADQMAVIYGLSGAGMAPQFSNEEIERMRQVLSAHDATNKGLGGMKEFDLNNPPKLPYRHLEYPKHVGYDKKGVLLIAANAQQEAELEKRVFSKTPPPPRKVREKVDTSEDGKVAPEE